MRIMYNIIIVLTYILCTRTRWARKIPWLTVAVAVEITSNSLRAAIAITSTRMYH